MNQDHESYKLSLFQGSSAVVGASLGVIGFILVAVIVIALICGSRKRKEKDKKGKFDNRTVNRTSLKIRMSNTGCV